MSLDSKPESVAEGVLCYNVCCEDCTLSIDPTVGSINVLFCLVHMVFAKCWHGSLKI